MLEQCLLPPPVLPTNSALKRCNEYNDTDDEEDDDTFQGGQEPQKTQDEIRKQIETQRQLAISATTAHLVTKSTIQQCLQPFYQHMTQNRIRVSVRLPTNDRYLLMLDKGLYRTCAVFIDVIVDKFSLDPQIFRSPQGFFVKELTDCKVARIEDIGKDDQLVLLSEHLVKNFNPAELRQQNPEENQEEFQRILQKRQQPAYFGETFGNTTLQPPPPVKDELLQAFNIFVIICRRLPGLVKQEFSQQIGPFLSHNTPMMSASMRPFGRSQATHWAYDNAVSQNRQVIIVGIIVRGLLLASAGYPSPPETPREVRLPKHGNSRPLDRVSRFSNLCQWFAYDQESR
ncbi:hypothetical protein FGO68_gene16439 [Halteria grandinella]|uniref:Uncharacterized protein n=1 Tax=Halteria grandinella TaxID=5974 RepID=A0A8J8T4B7_HALGN|nr:hypothetical protein FGO68_gene16439 [Halteria grandinella]